MPFVKVLFIAVIPTVSKLRRWAFGLLRKDLFRDRSVSRPPAVGCAVVCAGAWRCFRRTRLMCATPWPTFRRRRAKRRQRRHQWPQTADLLARWGRGAKGPKIRSFNSKVVEKNCFGRINFLGVYLRWLSNFFEHCSESGFVEDPGFLLNCSLNPDLGFFFYQKFSLFSPIGAIYVFLVTEVNLQSPSWIQIRILNPKPLRINWPNKNRTRFGAW